MCVTLTQEWTYQVNEVFSGISGAGAHLVRFFLDFRGWGSSCEVFSGISGDGAHIVRFFPGYPEEKNERKKGAASVFS